MRFAVRLLVSAILRGFCPFLMLRGGGIYLSGRTIDQKQKIPFVPRPSSSALASLVRILLEYYQHALVDARLAQRRNRILCGIDRWVNTRHTY